MFDLANKFGIGRKRSMVMDAVPEDFGPVANLHASSFPRGWSKLEIQRLAEQAQTHLLVVRNVGGTANSVAGFNIYSLAAGEAEILSIAVDPKLRRNGLAEKLMRETILRLVAERAEALFLEVDSTNAAAVHLYEKLGFETVGARPAYYSGSGDENDRKRSTALIMKLDLVSANHAG